jgi:hypothetical protein
VPLIVTQLSTVVTGIDWTPSRRSGHSIFCMPSMYAVMRPDTDGSLTNTPTELLWRYGAVAQMLVSDATR